MSASQTPIQPRKRLRLYSRLDARFACGLLAALAAGTQGALKVPKAVEKGQPIERPASGITQAGSGYDRVGEVFRDPKTGKLVLIEPAPAKENP
jgi:hypothetical protein